MAFALISQIIQKTILNQLTTQEGLIKPGFDDIVITLILKYFIHFAVIPESPCVKPIPFPVVAPVEIDALVFESQFHAVTMCINRYSFPLAFLV